MSFKDLFHFKKKKETLPGEIGKEIYPWIRFWNICFSVMTIVYVMLALILLVNKVGKE